MNHSGDAAEQIVRISLEGVDYAIRITGSAAKNIAAFLLVAFKSDGADGKIKLKGKERLVNMLKSGKETKIFAIKNNDLKQFATEAKRYGVTYCVLKDKNGPPDSLVEIMVTDTDAGKISRIMDRLEFAAVDIGAVEAAPSERDALDMDDTDKLLNELFDEEGKAKVNAPEAEKAVDAAEQDVSQNPTRAGQKQSAEKGTLSEPRSEMPSSLAEEKRSDKKPASVKQFLRERTAQAAKKKEEKQAERTASTTQKKAQKSNQPGQPQWAVKKKIKPKERG